MSLTQAEQKFLAGHRLAMLATVGPDGGPQNKPVGYTYNDELGTIDIYGLNMAQSAKYRNVARQPLVALVVDDASGVGPATCSSWRSGARPRRHHRGAAAPARICPIHQNPPAPGGRAGTSTRTKPASEPAISTPRGPTAGPAVAEAAVAGGGSAGPAVAEAAVAGAAVAGGAVAGGSAGRGAER